MSYTNEWSDVIPLGSEAASHIDDAIRQVRLDIHERMNDIVVNWTSDPVVLQTVGVSADNSRYLPPSAFTGVAFNISSGANTHFLIGATSSGVYIAPLSSYLPFNATITRIKYWIDRGNLTSLECKVVSIPFGAGAFTSTDVAATIITTSTSGIQTLDTGTISVVLDSTKMYAMYMTPTGGSSFSIYGAFVEFTT